MLAGREYVYVVLAGFGFFSKKKMLNLVMTRRIVLVCGPQLD